MMLDVGVLPSYRKLDKRLSNNNFGYFLPVILSPIRDSRMTETA
jgi:hypothetical protein